LPDHRQALVAKLAALLAEIASTLFTTKLAFQRKGLMNMATLTGSNPCLPVKELLLEQQVASQIHGLTLGYEGFNDQGTLRKDMVWQSAAQRRPQKRLKLLLQRDKRQRFAKDSNDRL
jgi:hypothetical protein